MFTSDRDCSNDDDDDGGDDDDDDDAIHPDPAPMQLERSSPAARL